MSVVAKTKICGERKGGGRWAEGQRRCYCFTKEYSINIGTTCTLHCRRAVVIVK